MNKVEALDDIRAAWTDDSLSLGEKIMRISQAFFEAGLDLASTAAFIRATPAELDALIALGGLDDETIDAISKANPPKTAWTLLANANEEEIAGALEALKSARDGDAPSWKIMSTTEFVYDTMLEVAGPTIEQRVGGLPGDVLFHALKKAEDFSALNAWEMSFLKGVATTKKKGRTLSAKQTAKLIRILTNLAEQEVIKRDSIDGDQVICDEILDALGR